MAQLTWRNVDAPSFAAPNQLLVSAANTMNNGFNAARQTLQDYAKADAASEDAKLMASIQRYQDPSSLKTALNNGTAFNGIDISKLTPDSLKFVSGAAQGLLDQDRTAVGTQYTRQSIKTNQQTYDQTEIDNTRKNNKFAAIPGANTLLSDINRDLQSADPNVVAAARARIGSPEFAKTMSAAGLTPEDLMKFNSGIKDTVDQGLGIKTNLDNAGNANAIKAGTRHYQDDPRTMDEKVRELQARPDLDPIVRMGILENLKKNAPLNPQFNSDQLRDDIILRRNGAGPSIMGMVDRTEGGGRYDTLFGHAQAKNTPFAGVDVSRMSVGQAVQFASPDGAYGNWVKNQLANSGQEARIATPMGRFQIVGSTLKQAVQEMGLSPDTPFNDQTQNAIFEHLVNKRLSGPLSMTGKIANLRQEWEGFKNVPDEQLASAISRYEAGDRSALIGSGGFSGGGGGPQGGSSARSMLAQASGNQAPAQAPADPLALMDRGRQLAAQINTDLNSSAGDKAFDPYENITQALVDPESSKVSAGGAAKKIYENLAKGEKGGAFDESVSLPVIEGEIKRLTKAYGMAPGAAAAVVENAIAQNENWFRPNTRYIDTALTDQIVKEYRGGDGNGNVLQAATARISASQGRGEAATLIKKALSDYQEAEKKFSEEYGRAQDRGDTKEMEKASKRFQIRLADAEKRATEVRGSGKLTPANLISAAAGGNTKRGPSNNPPLNPEAAAAQARSQAAATLQAMVGTPLPPSASPQGLPVMAPEDPRAFPTPGLVDPLYGDIARRRRAYP